MIVRLPRKCLGKEIVDAFKEASSLKNPLNSCFEKWEGILVVGEIQYEPGSVKRVIKSLGVTTYPYFLMRRWLGLFGRKISTKDLDISFSLRPVSLMRQYASVEIDVRYIGWDFVCMDPKDPEFESIRPDFEKILGNFYELLSK